MILPEVFDLDVPFIQFFDRQDKAYAVVLNGRDVGNIGEWSPMPGDPVTQSRWVWRYYGSDIGYEGNKLVNSGPWASLEDAKKEVRQQLEEAVHRAAKQPTEEIA